MASSKRPRRLEAEAASLAGSREAAERELGAELAVWSANPNAATARLRFDESPFVRERTIGTSWAATSIAAGEQSLAMLDRGSDASDTWVALSALGTSGYPAVVRRAQGPTVDQVLLRAVLRGVVLGLHWVSDAPAWCAKALEWRTSELRLDDGSRATLECAPLTEGDESGVLVRVPSSSGYVWRAGRQPDEPSVLERLSDGATTGFREPKFPWLSGRLRPLRVSPTAAIFGLSREPGISAAG